MLWLVAISILLMILDLKYQSTDQIRSGIQHLLYPIQILVSQPEKILSSWNESFVTMRSMKETIADQKNSIRDLTLLSSISENLESENKNLRNLLQLQQQSPYSSIAAEVIYNPINPSSQKVVISRGKNDGILLGMPVANEGGIIGQVVRLYDSSAEVAVLEERDATIPVMVTRSGQRGVLFGVGRTSPLELRFISNFGDLDVGDYLSTSGIDGVFPPGIPVAIITKIERALDNSGAQISCRPLADLNTSKHLIVLLYRPSNDAPNPIVPESIKNKKNFKRVN
jgi:rod shape-determining protein MreC